MQILAKKNLYQENNEYSFILVKEIDYTNCKGGYDWPNKYFPNMVKDDHADAFTIYEKIDGIFYNEELASSEGLGVYLFCHDKIDKQTIKNVKAKIRHKSDVVYFKTLIGNFDLDLGLNPVDVKIGSY